MAVAEGDRMRILLLSIVLALGCTQGTALEPDLSSTPDLAETPDLGANDLAPAGDLAQAADLESSGDLLRSPDMAHPPAITAQPIWIGSGGSPSSSLSLCVDGFDVVGTTPSQLGAFFIGGFCAFQTY